MKENEIDDILKELLNDRFKSIVKQLEEMALTIDFSKLEDKEVVDILKAHGFSGTIVHSNNKQTYVLLDDVTDYYTTDELHKMLNDKINSLDGNNFLFFTSPEAIAEFVHESSTQDEIGFREPDRYNPKGYWYNKLTGKKINTKGNP